MTMKQWLLSSVLASTCLVPIAAGADLLPGREGISDSTRRSPRLARKAGAPRVANETPELDGRSSQRGLTRRPLTHNDHGEELRAAGLPE